jgi:DNA-binding NtrC family response regulator
MAHTVLIVDDEPAARHGMRRALEKEGYRILEADNIRAADQALESNSPAVVLLDVKLTSESGLDYLPSLVDRSSAPLVIIVTAHRSERTAVEAIKKGAYDYLGKPFDVNELRILVGNACETFRLRAENERLRQERAGIGTFGSLIGSSPQMKRVYSLIDKVAQTDVSVLISGESGTGKELVAREIHSRSTERPGPFVAVNCAAMPEQLIESELFGHEKGAFTGASARRIGKFELADRGTLFLDEIGDMSLSTQAKILRVLEERSFERLGSNQTHTSDVRVVSATNKNLVQAAEQNQFRADLYYRLSVVVIPLPALRNRPSDIPSLAQTFCERFSTAYRKKAATLSSTSVEVLLEYDWPGNVRELRNCIERAVVLSDKEEITLNAIQELQTSNMPSNRVLGDPSSITKPSKARTLREARKDFEREYVEDCLNQAGGNITQAAALLGMHRQSLQHKIRELGLTKKFTISD